MSDVCKGCKEEKEMKLYVGMASETDSRKAEFCSWECIKEYASAIA